MLLILWSQFVLKKRKRKESKTNREKKKERKKETAKENREKREVKDK